MDRRRATSEPRGLNKCRHGLGSRRSVKKYASRRLEVGVAVRRVGAWTNLKGQRAFEPLPGHIFFSLTCTPQLTGTKPLALHYFTSTPTLALSELSPEISAYGIVRQCAHWRSTSESARGGNGSDEIDGMDVVKLFQHLSQKTHHTALSTHERS